MRRVYFVSSSIGDGEWIRIEKQIIALTFIYAYKKLTQANENGKKLKNIHHRINLNLVTFFCAYKMYYYPFVCCCHLMREHYLVNE